MKSAFLILSLFVAGLHGQGFGYGGALKAVASFRAQAAGVSHGSTNYDTPGSYTFTVPAGITSITGQVWGAGGGGANSDLMTFGGGGGGGGGYNLWVRVVMPGDELIINCGTGGLSGESGGNSSIFYADSFQQIAGGGGSAVDSSVGGDSGAGSLGDGFDIVFEGGAGGVGDLGGGAGAGGAQTTSDGSVGGNASGSTGGTANSSGDGGSGGDGGSVGPNNGNGFAGSQTGGGGGGGALDINGGLGATGGNGKVRLSW